MQTQLSVVHAGPLISVQDAGRLGHLRFGVTASGAMDRTSFTFANAALGNTGLTPAIEVSLGGLTLKCTEGSVSMAIVGGHFSSLLNDKPLPPWCMFTINAGDTLKVRPGSWGSWCYCCFSGQIESHEWMGSQSVHLKSGVCGTAITNGDTLSINNCTNTIDNIVSLGEPNDFKPTSTVRAVIGPQDRFFDAKTLDNLFNKPFTVSSDYDRMGMRFDGCQLPVTAALDMPSEPITRGSLQVPGHGNPICLMADHHTAGGYPKIATVISTDLDGLAQFRSGDEIHFQSVSTADAIEIARKRQAFIDQWRAHIMLNTVSITERLWNNNLISGVV